MATARATTNLPQMATSPRNLFKWGGAGAAGPFAADQYLTDGRRLFRVVSRFDPRSAEGFAVLENCFTLDVDTYTPDELFAMELRTVRRAGERLAAA
jgi:hypothetical protein